jgi:hypothetical protein
MNIRRPRNGTERRRGVWIKQGGDSVKEREDGVEEH